MVFLLNFLPALIVITFGLIIRYAVPSKVGKVVFATLGVLLLFVYFQIQPSYLPKGTVKPMSSPGFEVVQKPIEDRQLKPKSADERDSKMREYEKESDARREALIEQVKSEKE